MRQWMVGLGLLVGSFVFAAGLQDAQALYAKGDWQKAADTAAAVGSSDGFAFAAKSNSVLASVSAANLKEGLYAKSEGYANQAIKLDPKNDEGYFELARAFGRLSQVRGILAALTQGLGQKVRENLDKAIALNPKHAGAKVALGLWHAEIVGKGVAWLYGADAAKVAPLMDEALKLEPNIIIHKVEYAKALLLLDKAKNKAKAIDLLEAALKLKPSDAAEKLDFERAQADLAELK